MSEPTTSATAAASAASAATLHDVRVVYGDHFALTVDRLEVPAGRVVAVIGPNGSGKSTLLGLLSGLVRPVSGHVTVLGGRPAERAVAHVLQETSASAAVPLTVRDVVRIGRYARVGLVRRMRAEDHEAVGQAMERLGIADLANRQLAELSGGERQRVYLAQGLAQEADLLLLDEPATGLDLPTRERIAAILAEERAAGRTVVLTTHDVAEASDADHAVLLAGRVVAAGAPPDVLVPEHLGAAYRGRFQLTPTGAVVLDDPHHHH